MADNYLTPNAGPSEVPLEHEFRESLSFLNVLCLNEFDKDQIDNDVALQTESEFYKGAPPTWLNFALAESPKTDTTAEVKGQIGLVKRDGYAMLSNLIKHQQQGSCSVNTIRLQHQPGSGGSTLAMQILWDLRKEFRCALLIDPAADKKDIGKQTQREPHLDSKTIAKQVIELFHLGDQDNQNTVLLLQDNEYMKENLQDCIIKEITEQKLRANIPVVIILKCIRVKYITDDDDDDDKDSNQVDTILTTNLSGKEKDGLNAKYELIKIDHGDDHRRFYGFNVMLNNFSEDYVKKIIDSGEGKEMTKYIQQNQNTQNTKLFAFIALLNAYVPGSYILKSECESFLSQRGMYFRDLQPFRDLIVTYPSPLGQDRRVRMAHPAVAHQCVKTLAKAGVKRSTTTLEFLRYLSRNQTQTSLLQFFRDMLTKRETSTEGQDKFSRLILDIEENEDIPQCANVLKNASETFKYDPFYPQTLARFYYIKMKDFTRAELWAEKAKQRVPTNSFIADTLGQVHKNHLHSTFKNSNVRDICFWAEKSIQAFKQEEILAERESLSYMDSHDQYATKMSHVFNNRGLFGYFQVANTVYDALTNIHPKWRQVLNHEIPVEHVLTPSGDQKLMKYSTFITSLKVNVERKFYDYFESYFTYSAPQKLKDQPPYFSREVRDCYLKYAGVASPTDLPFQTLKYKMASTFQGLVSLLNSNSNLPDLDKITDLWKTIHTDNRSDINATCNYILANIILSKDKGVNSKHVPLPELRAILQRVMNEVNPELWTPEFYLVIMLFFWPEEVKGPIETSAVDLNKYIGPMKLAYERKYKKYLYHRDLVSLFYLGKGTGMQRLVHKSKIDEILEQLRKKKESGKIRGKRGSGRILKDSGIQDLLPRIHGVARAHRVFATVADQEIEIFPHKQGNVWKNGNICFYLGFNIRGPVAFNISYKTEPQSMESKGVQSDHLKRSEELGIPRCCKECDHVKDTTHWRKIAPSVSKNEGVQIYRHTTCRGHYECKVSGLRWACKSDVVLRYHFSNWEPYCMVLGVMQYTQCGPLLDIVMETGVLEEIHLPHFGCLEKDISFKDGVRVLHVEESGMSVEKVQEVTCFHAKLLHPTFSPKGVLIRSGFPFKVHCDLMVYLSKTDYVCLRIYLIPSDPALVEAVKKQESAHGFKQILVPRPERCLKMKSWFKLQANCKASVEPEKIKLRYVNTTPSFFKVQLQDSMIDFEMELICGEESVCKTSLREADFRDMVVSVASPSPVVVPQGFVKKQRQKLIETATNAVQIADALVSKTMISEEEYSSVEAAITAQNRMRKLLACVIPKGAQVENAFISALHKYNPYLLEALLRQLS